MKRKIGILLLVLCLLVCLLPTGNDAAAASVCFIAINDDLLTLNNTPYISGGTIYVSAGILSYFGVYSSAFPQDNTMLLYNASTQLFFDLNTGTSYDSAGNTYSTGAVATGGGVYYPVNFVGSFFGGFSASYISGNAYGDIVRITNGSQILSDKSFLSAASDLMRFYYNTYFGITASASPSPSPSPSAEPTPSPTPTPIDGDVFLNFIGLPSEAVLSSLNSREFKACFFVTEDEIRSDPAGIRRLVVQGHHIGLYCESAPAESYAAVLPLLYECIREPVLLVTGSETTAAATAELAAQNGLVLCSFDLLTNAETTLDNIERQIRSANGRFRIGFTAQENTDSLVEALSALLKQEGVTVKAANEIQ